MESLLEVSLLLGHSALQLDDSALQVDDLVLEDLGGEREECDEVLVGHLQVLLPLAADHGRQHLLQLLRHEAVAGVLRLRAGLELEGHGPQLPQHPAYVVVAIVACSPSRGAGHRLGLRRGGPRGAAPGVGDGLVQRHDGVLQPAVRGGHGGVGHPRAVELSPVGRDGHASVSAHLHFKLRVGVVISDVRAFVAEVEVFAVDGQGGAHARIAAQRDRGAEEHEVKNRELRAHARERPD
mmetsp:Transcript_60937/g.160272  ORF Transcript_60937/g.160272 Transcript_60937/m.160272 type:complete len:238 (-) Transcript_60937:2785-3498(-)